MAKLPFRRIKTEQKAIFFFDFTLLGIEEEEQQQRSLPARQPSHKRST